VVVLRICCEKTLRDILEISTSIESVGKSFDVIKGVAEAIVGRGCRYFYFTGCGSSYYSAMLVSFPLLVEGIDVGVYVLPSSEILMYYSSRLSRECCLVAISRSGETAETLDVLKIGRERGVYSIVITISERSRARDYVDSYLYIDVGAERGVVMTKSFFSMTLAGLMLTRSIAGMISGKIYDITSQLPILKEYVETVINGREKILSLARSYVERGVKRFVFLGSGPAHPIALEGSLKLKESTYIATEALHALEFRHGPIATVDENQVIVVLNQDGESYNYVYKLYKELLSMGSYVLRLSSRDVDENTIPIARTDFEELNVLSAIVPLQLFAYGYASALGLDIDNPRNLVKVVKQY
jgi:glucosamine--fructose-6-phosphate aminotransferase (isomerizing)